VVIFSCTVRAGPGAEFAADAGFRIDENNAVFLAFVTGTRRANGNAGGVFTMQARARHVDDAGIISALLFDFIAVDAI
jgi:hypothetical protein